MSKIKIVFLGSPQVAARSLQQLIQSSAQLGVDIVAVVSQPPNERFGKSSNTPVHNIALENSIPCLTPVTAGDPEFLQSIANINPDICITAAYGQILSSTFLSIPKLGTINIHPSLLPQYRGAAPVQRTLRDGATRTGVTLCFTVLAMDAGPIISQVTSPIGENENHHELLFRLFELGTSHLIDILPQIIAQKIVPTPQIHANATLAKKVKHEDGLLNFSLSAQEIHNTVRAFYGWPGTRGMFAINGVSTEIKIIKTQIAHNVSNPLNTPIVIFNKNLFIFCQNNNPLQILELQLPGKKALTAKDFINGLGSKTLTLI